MIVSLKSANFSADNIGQITVPHPLSDYTLAAIAAGGRTNLSDAQKTALDVFFTTIGAGTPDSIASRMRYIFIPAFAGSLSTALVNYKDSTFAVEKTPDSTVWSVNASGLVAADSGSSKAITLTLASPLRENNACLLFFRGALMPTTNPGNQHYLSIRGVQSTSKWLSMYQYQNTETLGHFTTGGLPSQWITGGYTEEVPTINGYNLKGTTAKKIIGGTVSDVTAPSVDMSTETSQTIYAFGMSSKNTVPTAFAMLGEGLTDLELSAVINAVESLKNALLA